MLKMASIAARNPLAPAAEELGLITHGQRPGTLSARQTAFQERPLAYHDAGNDKVRFWRALGEL